MLPGGRVTFLFTDVEGSTALLRRVGPDEYLSLLKVQEAAIRVAVTGVGGALVSVTGDGTFAAFADAGAAVAAAVAVQEALCGCCDSAGVPLRVRMGLHRGIAEPVDGEYAALAVNQAARVVTAANGGQVLCSAAVAEAAPGVAFHDWGRHKLRDFDGPQRLLEPGGPSDRPPRAPAAGASALPRFRTSLVGRAAEITQVRTLLADERLVTLVAPGGAGKTRLAVEVAKEEDRRFDGRVAFVDLAAIGDPARAATAALRAVGAPDDPHADPLEALAAHLGTDAWLLVVDNCEHVLDAAADLVAAVLDATEATTVLATSRSPLRVTGERLAHLGPLGLPPEHAGPEEVADCDAVALFVQRVAAGDDGFALGPANARAVTELVRALDGMPLAIELAAGRVASLGVDALAGRLGSHLRLLSTAGRSVPERHRSVQAVIAWSHDLLDDAERTLLRRLSMFAGGFRLDDAEAVAAFGALRRDDVAGLLAGLVEANLVRTLAAEADQPQRHRLLVAVGLFGQERLADAGEVDDIRARHLAHFTGLAHRAVEDLASERIFASQAALAADLPNIDIAVERALVADPVGALRLAVEAASPRTWLGDYRGSRDAVIAAAAAAGDAAPVLLRARAAHELGRIATLGAGEHAAAIALLSRAAAQLDAAGEEAARDRALLDLSMARRLLGQFDDATPLVEQVLASARRRGDQRTEMRSLYLLGVMATVTGRPGAEGFLTESERLAVGLGDLWAAMSAPVYRAELLLRQGGRADEVTALLRESHPFFARLGDSRTEIVIHWRLARAALQRADLADAAAELRSAWAIVAGTHVLGFAEPVLARAVEVCLRLRRPTDAARLLGAHRHLVAVLPGIDPDDEARLRGHEAELAAHLGEAATSAAVAAGAAAAATDLLGPVGAILDEVAASTVAAAAAG